MNTFLDNERHAGYWAVMVYPNCTSVIWNFPDQDEAHRFAKQNGTNRVCDPEGNWYTC